MATVRAKCACGGACYIIPGICGIRPALHDRDSADGRSRAGAARPLQPRRRMMIQDSPAGLRILVVEDEMLIAILIEDMLQDLGCHVVGPVSRLDAALRLAHEEPLNAA